MVVVGAVVQTAADKIPRATLALGRKEIHGYFRDAIYASA